jgi:hypothetical protein
MGTILPPGRASRTMRRLRPLGSRFMARPLVGEVRPGTWTWPELSARQRTLAGWLAAVALIFVVAGVVRLVGDAGGAGGDRAEDTASGRSLATISFGTAIDTATGEVATAARSDRFLATDSFAYSARASFARSGETVDVEVLRVTAGEPQVVQARAPQLLAGPPGIMAFQVPADALFRDFGPGDYLMRIYPAGKSAPLAEGRFSLVAPVPTAS